ncbi:MAG: RluA family pseudouridine synthase [Clostridia bacterium]|nr:RluA family pseudouridine synthase [Clostridia bacterium]
MKEYIINKNDSDQRLDKFIQKTVKSLPKALMYKYIRQKKIKVNKKRAEISTRLFEGDVISLYINDEFFAPSSDNSDFKKLTVNLDIVYEDENILLINKPVGLICHSDDKESYNTLISHIKAYLYEKGEYIPENENSFVPSLCNRIDRNTQGIVIAAKNAQTLKIINDKIKNREIEKYYLCLVHGRPKKSKDTLKGYMLKNEKTNTVKVYDKQIKGSKTAITEYEVISSFKDISLCKIHLITGRTHQIRCHMASIGHPLLGDGKYGTNEMNKKYPFRFQTLCSYKTLFDFKSESGILDYLNGKSFCVKNIDFVSKYFPEIHISKL